MNLMIALIVVALFVFIAVYGVMSVVFRRRIDVDKRVRQHHPSGEEQKNWRQILLRLEGLFKPLGEIIPRSPEEMSKHEKRLAQAGYRRKDAVVLFYGAQFGLALILLVVSLLTGYVYTSFLL